MPIVLVVEDDPLIALWLAQIVAEATGARVVVAATVGSAERQVVPDLGFVLLDVNLRNETTYELARQIRSKNIPFAFTSGSNRSAIPDDLRSALFLSKPVRTRDIVAAVQSALSSDHAPHLHQRNG